MIVQRCLKGIYGINKSDADTILDEGILCNWTRYKTGGPPTAKEIRTALTANMLDLHVNNYASVQATTPFISLSAGCVSRDALVQAN